MGKFQDRLDMVDCHLVAKIRLFGWLMEFASDYADRGDEATKEWFG